MLLDPLSPYASEKRNAMAGRALSARPHQEKAQRAERRGRTNANDDPHHPSDNHPSRRRGRLYGYRGYGGPGLGGALGLVIVVLLVLWLLGLLSGGVSHTPA